MAVCRARQYSIVVGEGGIILNEVRPSPVFLSVVPDKNVSNLANVRQGAILSPFGRIRNLNCDSQRRMRLPIEGGGRLGGGGGGGGGSPEVGNDKGH
jgi:hypothetical protein